ncbi:MAG: glycosyltransferase family 8 protein [Oscillospiraceae bacterium]|nr:glycosyltransferase family 8 protein [Oscillospiraceae bacterium]
MNIVYASDENFAEIMGVSIVSLFENNKNINKIDIYIIDDNISMKNKKSLVSLSDSYNRNIYFITAPDISKTIGIKIDSQHWVVATYLRLFIVSLLPNNIEKTLYLDCDTIILGSIDKLYNKDISSFHGAGVLNPFSEEEKLKIGLKAEDNYFNAGVLLLNIAKMRHDNIEKIFKNFIIKFNGMVPYNDQGVINGTIGNTIAVLPSVYNVLSLNFALSYKAMCKYMKSCINYSESEYLKAIKHPIIIHFTGNIILLRPWIKGCTHPYSHEWLKYKDLSPWKCISLHENKQSIIHNILIRIYKLLPEIIAIRVARFIYKS